MSEIDLVAKKIKELRALRNPNRKPTPRFDIAAIGLGMIGATMLLLAITIAVLLG